MKYLKMLCCAALAAMVLTALTASTASATTLEVKGVTQNSAVEISASLASGTSSVLQKTDGSFANTCTSSSMVAKTNVFTGVEDVGGPVNTLTFTSCSNEKVVVDKAGTLTIRWIAGTTKGTVYLAESVITVPSPFGSLTCNAGTHTHIGTLTGTSIGRGTLHLNAVLNCGFLAPSATWTGTYTVTSPEGLGVVG